MLGFAVLLLDRGLSPGGGEQYAEANGTYRPYDARASSLDKRLGWPSTTLERDEYAPHNNLR